MDEIEVPPEAIRAADTEVQIVDLQARVAWLEAEMATLEGAIAERLMILGCLVDEVRELVPRGAR